MSDRLSLALERGVVALPDGELLVVGATVSDTLDGLPKDRTTILSRFADADHRFARLGWNCVTEAPFPVDGAIVFLPRSREAQRGYMKLAARVTEGGPIIVDGNKTNGIDAFYRDVKNRVETSEAWSKAHGKVFVASGREFSDWPSTGARLCADDWWRAPGAFSADGIDQASAFLSDALPKQLTGAVVDLGAGWGYLSKAILGKEGVVHLDLVENDFDALSAAQENITDARAELHWADALTWRPDALVDHVVTNPPFHVGRAADPALGQAFIQAAAAMLKPKGQLWLVANRHLPYEGTLKDAFRTVELHAEKPSFKIFHATSPTRRKG